jgi:hypothetical protein
VSFAIWLTQVRNAGESVQAQLVQVIQISTTFGAEVERYRYLYVTFERLPVPLAASFSLICSLRAFPSGVM